MRLSLSGNYRHWSIIDHLICFMSKWISHGREGQYVATYNGEYVFGLDESELVRNMRIRFGDRWRKAVIARIEKPPAQPSKAQIRRPLP